MQCVLFLCCKDSPNLFTALLSICLLGKGKQIWIWGTLLPLGKALPLPSLASPHSATTPLGQPTNNHMLTFPVVLLSFAAGPIVIHCDIKSYLEISNLIPQPKCNIIIFFLSKQVFFGYHGHQEECPKISYFCPSYVLQRVYTLKLTQLPHRAATGCNYTKHLFFYML